MEHQKMGKRNQSRHLYESAYEEWVEANKQWDEGNHEKAYAIFLSSAQKGLSDAQNSVGYFLDNGIGVSVDKREALKWYRAAARQCNCCAISNIGTIYRDAGNVRRAMFWFRRAYKESNDGDSGLEIAKLLFGSRTAKRREEACRILSSIMTSDNITEDSREEAAKLFSELCG